MYFVIYMQYLGVKPYEHKTNLKPT